MGKALEMRLKCGCEVWTGSDYDGIPYVLVEHCPMHIVKVGELAHGPARPRSESVSSIK